MLQNITLSAELQLLRRAREKAMKEKRSLNYKEISAGRTE